MDTMDMGINPEYPCYMKPILITFFISLSASVIPYSTYASAVFIPRVEVKDVLTRQQTTGSDDSGNIFSLAPGFSYSTATRLVKADIDYELVSFNTSGIEGDSSTNQRLKLDSEILHIPGKWVTKTFGQIQQTNISANGLLSTDHILNPENSTEVRMLGVDTTLSNHWKNDISYSVSLGADVTDNEESKTSSGQGIKVAIDNYLSHKQITFSIVSNSEYAYDDSGSEEITQNEVTLGYRFNQKLSTYLNATTRDSGSKFLDETSTLIGFKWTPSKLSSINLGIGERGDDSSYKLEAFTKRRNTVLSASYSEELTTSRKNVINTIQANANVSDLVQDLSIQPILLKHGKLGLTITGRRSNLNISMFQKSKISENKLLQDEVTNGVEVEFNRHISARSFFTIGVLSQEISLDQTNKLNELTASWEHNLSNKISTTIDLTHAEQTSSEPSNEYRQTLLGFSLKAIF